LAASAASRHAISSALEKAGKEAERADLERAGTDAFISVYRDEGCGIALHMFASRSRPLIADVCTSDVLSNRGCAPAATRRLSALGLARHNP